MEKINRAFGKGDYIVIQVNDKALREAVLKMLDATRDVIVHDPLTKEQQKLLADHAKERYLEESLLLGL